MIGSGKCTMWVFPHGKGGTERQATHENITRPTRIAGWILTKARI